MYFQQTKYKYNLSVPYFTIKSRSFDKASFVFFCHLFCQAKLHRKKLVTFNALRYVHYHDEFKSRSFKSSSSFFCLLFSNMMLKEYRKGFRAALNGRMKTATATFNSPERVVKIDDGVCFSGATLYVPQFSWKKELMQCAVGLSIEFYRNILYNNRDKSQK